MSVLDQFRNIVKSPHNYARDWKKRTGGKVLGYLCSNLPEELLYAAGVLPIRLLGTNEVEDITRPYIFQAGFCSFARDCYAQALKGNYDYIDGVAFAQACPHAREVFHNWQEYQPISFSYELMVPMYLQNRHAGKYLTAEMGDFCQSLEKWTGKKVSQEALDNAIELYNTNRHLMMKVYDLLKADSPAVTEAEVAEMALAGFLIDKETHNRMLQEAIQELSTRPANNSHKPRLMLLGSVNTDLEFLRFIDSLGGRVVMDDYCTGNRYYQQDVIPGEDRFAALAGRLIQKPPCPLKDIPERRRVTHILKQASEYRVQGVIYTIQRLCDPHGLDYPAIEAALKGQGIPMLKLELDYTVPIGQFRTRIEAFLEMIEEI